MGVKVLSKTSFIKKFRKDQRAYKKRIKEEQSRKPKDSIKSKILFNDDQKNDIIKRYRDGEAMNKICLSYNCGKETIRRRLREWGVR